MLSSTSSSAVYQGGGGQTAFPIPFPFQEDSHIHAHLRSPAGSRALARGTDYAVSRLAGGGGEIVLLGELPAPGTELVVRRLLPLTQEILFHNQGPNSPAAVEEAVDKLTMIAQQLAGRLDAAMPAPPADGRRYLAAGGSWVEYAPPPPPPPPAPCPADHARLSNRSAPGQHPQSAIVDLPGDLEAIRASLCDLAGAVAAAAATPPASDDADETDDAGNAQLAGLSSRVAAVEAAAGELSATTAELQAASGQLSESTARLSAASSGLESGLADTNALLAGVLADLAEVQASLAGLGALARAVDAPADGEAYLRRDGAWTRHVAESGGSSSGGPPSGGSSAIAASACLGEIRLLPFRPDDLPPGWHVLDGSSFSRGTPQYDAVALLPANFISDWGISKNSFWAVMPDLRGSVFRAAAAGETPGVVAAGGSAGTGGAACAMTPAIYLGDS